MKKAILTLAFMATILMVNAQTNEGVVKNQLYIAQLRANPKDRMYNPKLSFGVFSKYAQLGNGQAMNGLAMLYSQGIGVSVDYATALGWFEQATQHGYSKAWYNLGSMYRIGLGTKLDLFKAYDCYKKGAILDDPHSLYGQGYMLYKGLGCSQSYERSFEFFSRGAAKRDVGAMYMLGLCYRNGYGTAQNLDSAKYWLDKSSRRGYLQATDELIDPTPENIDIKDVPNLQPSIGGANSSPADLKNGFKRVKHNLPSKDIEGKYEGYIIKFDWSGKHIIGEERLKLHLSYKNKMLTGEWIEKDAYTPVTGTLTDSAIVFNNTSINKKDHYNQKVPNTLEFRDARLNLTKSKDTVFITGNISLYSISHKEPEKPEFIMLISTGNKIDLRVDSASNDIASLKTDSLHFVAYPNPFSTQLHLRFTLKKDALVSITVTNLLNGTMVYRSAQQFLKTGDHDTPINFSGLPGNYVVTLQYGNKIKSAIVFKQ